MKFKQHAACALLGAVMALAASPAAALNVTHQVVVQPIQVCYSAGAQCGDLTSLSDGSLESFADRMFGLAGLDVQFLPAQVFNTTSTGLIEEHFSRFQTEAGLGPIGGRTVVGAFFDPAFGPNFTVGLGWLGAAGLLTGTNGLSVPTVLAHELGHNLGLEHYDTGSTNNLMSYFGSTCSVTDCSLADEQIVQMQGNFASLTFVHAVTAVPEPAAWAMWLLGGMIGVWRLRRRVAPR